MKFSFQFFKSFNFKTVELVTFGLGLTRMEKMSKWRVNPHEALTFTLEYETKIPNKLMIVYLSIMCMKEQQKNLDKYTKLYEMINYCF